MLKISNYLALLLLWIASMALAQQAKASGMTCLYLNSYHAGYEWSDRMHTQFTKSIGSECQQTLFYLNAKHASEAQLMQKGAELARIIKTAKPDIIIAADDAASQYVIQPYLKNSNIPIIFIGINWDPTTYGYPMDNATGMTEMWPLAEVVRIVHFAVKPFNKLTIISSKNPLESIDTQQIAKAAQSASVEVDAIYVSNFEAWKQAIINAQASEAIYLGSFQGIQNWSEAQAIAWMKQHNRRFTFASQDDMSPYVMFSLSKSPEEFGLWAAKLTKVLLDGIQPWQIPVVPNQQFNPVINMNLLNSNAYSLPTYIKRNAIYINEAIHYEAQ